MAYEYAYQLQSAPTATTDGAYIVSHDIKAVYREAESEDSWQEVPGNRKNFNLPTDQVKTVMDMPDSTGLERSAKNKAYKNLMITYESNLPIPITGWDEASLNLKVTNNDASQVEAERINTYITVTLSQTYPVEFNLDL